jgi:hypothetical protein
MIRRTNAPGKRHWFQVSIRTLLLLITALSVYLAAYVALVQPVVIVDEGLGGMVVSGYREPEFRVGGSAAKIMFGPLVWLDRAVRPSYWEPFSDFDAVPSEASP